MHRWLRGLGAAVLLLAAFSSFASAATRGLRIKDGPNVLVEVVDGVATGELSIEPGESLPGLEVFWLDDVLAEFQPASPPFSMAGTMDDPGVATYTAAGTWTFDAAAVSEGMTELTLELLNNGTPDYTSPPIEVHVEPALTVEGLVLRVGGQVIAQVWQGVATGEVAIHHEEITGPIEVTFLDADSLEFTPGAEFDLEVEIADTLIARLTDVQNWNFSVEGLQLGMTTLQVKIEHEGHFDFVSPDIEVHVEEPFEADGMVIRQNGNPVVADWQGVREGFLACFHGADSDTFEVTFLDPDSVDFTPGEDFSLVFEVTPGGIATPTATGDWSFLLHGDAVGTAEAVFKVGHEGHFDFISPPVPLFTYQTVSVGRGGEAGLEFAGAAPNPVVSRTMLRFALARESEVTLTIFDAAGRAVATVARGVHAAGEHAVEWRPGTAPPGLYFARLVTPSATFTRRVSLTR